MCRTSGRRWSRSWAISAPTEPPARKRCHRGSRRQRPTIDCGTLAGFRTSRAGLRQAKLAYAHACWTAGCVGPALPVLKYISTFRSGSRPSLPAARRRRGAAAGRGGRVGRSECPQGLVGRMLRDSLVRTGGPRPEMNSAISLSSVLCTILRSSRNTCWRSRRLIAALA